jgi:hypothetical protein
LFQLSFTVSIAWWGEPRPFYRLTDLSTLLKDCAE